ncbi:hypothetical protein [Methylobacterium sp. ID0610]|uniref:hypothetical protein n=1 Tax=Methylobacterium carpenticola TaxID=3344827 RepID=UPI0036A2A367
MTTSRMSLPETMGVISCTGSMKIAFCTVEASARPSSGGKNEAWPHAVFSLLMRFENYAFLSLPTKWQGPLVRSLSPRPQGKLRPGDAIFKKQILFVCW